MTRVDLAAPQLRDRSHRDRAHGGLRGRARLARRRRSVTGAHGQCRAATLWDPDGAGYWQRLRYVTLPSLRGILFLVLVVSTVNGFLMLDLIYVLTMGGPGYDTTTISWHGFRTSFTFFKFGPGTAILYTLTALCLFLTVVYHKLVLARFEPEA